MEIQHPIKLLLVEDQTILRTGLTLVLRRFSDLEIIGESDDGMDAVDKAIRLKPDVILMDISLRGMNGIDATKEIKKLQPQIKILALTSHEDEKSVLNAFSAGIDGYCPKDIREAQLYDAIKTVYAGQYWLEPSLAKKLLRSNRSKQKSDPKRESLTDSELGFFDLIMQGLDSRQVAGRLNISPESTRTLLRSILDKMKVMAQ